MLFINTSWSLLSKQFSNFFSTLIETKTLRAGLILPVARFERNLRKGRFAKRISSDGAVFMAAALEYLSAEVLELSAAACRQNKKKRIVPRHVMLAVENDAELKDLLKDVVFPDAGVVPNIETILNSRKSPSDEIVRYSQEI